MIHIITACSRPNNLEIISKTIPIGCNWIIVHDQKTSIPNIQNAKVMACEDTGIVGTKAQNYALNNINFQDEDFILLHDDDNIIHPDWYDVVSNIAHIDVSIITWGQINKDGTYRLPPTNRPQVNFIDTACFMIKWKYNKNIRHELVYDHDGFYAEACAKNGPVLCIDNYLCYYNYLR
jgi:hypothetical protein